jgi:hypothetical protein
LTGIVVSRLGRRDLILENVEDVKAFVTREMRGWDWLKGANPVPGQMKGVAGLYETTGWHPIQNELERPAQPASPFGNLQALLDRRYNDGKRLVVTDPEYEALRKLADETPEKPVLAATVLGFLSGYLNGNIFQSSYLENPIALRALGHALAIGAGIDSTAPSSAAAALESSRQEIEEALSGFRQIISSAREKASSETNRIASEATAEASARDQSFQNSEANRQNEFEALKKSLASTNEFYSKQMEVQGAVRYWGARSKTHKDNADNARWWLVLFAISATAVLLGVYYFGASWYLPDKLANDSIPLAALFKASAFGILLTTVAFWVGRVILRVYLSERHLATDAEERRTMVMTYLALIRSKKLAEDDKKLIIPAIFRSSSDGIVKEESSPDTAFAALVASFIKK